MEMFGIATKEKNNMSNNSILIGNGFDIQVGGDDYLNKWILVRLLVKAKMGKYNQLFMDEEGNSIITGDEIVELFTNVIPIANRAINKEFDDLVAKHDDADLVSALNDFEKNHSTKIYSFEQVGMEDWLLVFMLYLLEQKDILSFYETFKQGFERMIFDAIYCEGEIQKLYSKIDKGIVKYFESFNSVFTLNYDNTVEKLTENQLYHLHGDFETRHPSENPQNALGYLRIQSGQNVKFPQQFEHCNSTAILDFSGNKKYKYATNMTLAYRTVEQYKELVKCGVSTTEEILSKVPLASCEIVKTAIENNLIVGQNYYFDEFEQLQGTLTVIGLSPQNDSHIFECINKSNLDKVIFYHFFGKKPKKLIDKEMKKIKLPINKKYEIKNVQDKWDELGVVKPEDAKYTISEKQLEMVNALCFDKPVSAKDLICQLKSIPCTTKKLLLDLINYELSKDKYHTSPQSEKELYSIFAEFSKMLDIASLSPQVFFYFCFTEIYNK